MWEWGNHVRSKLFLYVTRVISSTINLFWFNLRDIHLQFPLFHLCTFIQVLPTPWCNCCVSCPLYVSWTGFQKRQFANALVYSWFRYPNSLVIKVWIKCQGTWDFLPKCGDFLPLWWYPVTSLQLQSICESIPWQCGQVSHATVHTHLI